MHLLGQFFDLQIIQTHPVQFIYGAFFWIQTGSDLLVVFRQAFRADVLLRFFNIEVIPVIKQDRSGIRRQGGKIPLVVVNVIVVQKGHMLLVQIIAGNPVVGTGEGKHNIKNGDHCHAIRKERKAVLIDEYGYAHHQ